jgi:hypothetical protein
MAVLYCFGIPAVSLWILSSKKGQIQRLQLISESLAELERGGAAASSSSGSTQGTTGGEMSRRFSGVGLELSRKVGATKEDLLKMEASIKEADPWLSGMSPLYKDYEVAYYWFEVSAITYSLPFLVPPSPPPPPLA